MRVMQKGKPNDLAGKKVGVEGPEGRKGYKADPKKPKAEKKKETQRKFPTL